MLKPRGFRHKLALALLVPLVLLGTAEGLLRLAVGLAPPDSSMFRSYEQTLVEMGGFADTGRLFEADAELFWRLRRNVHSLPWLPPLWLDNRTNSWGFRDLERDLERDPSSLRILCVGDSCTYGSGVRLADSYPQQLEALLAPQYPGRCVEIWNTGVPGYSSDQAVVFLRRSGRRIAADLVIVAVGLNDARHWDLRNHRERGHAACLTDREHREQLGRPLARLDRLLCRLQLYVALRGLLQKGPDDVEAPVPGADAAGGSVRVPLHEYRENLDALARECEELAVPLVLLSWPIRDQVQPRGDAAPYADETPYQVALQEFAAARGILRVDLVAALRGSEADLYVDSVHLNAAGCEKVALQIALALHSAGELPERP